MLVCDIKTDNCDKVCCCYDCLNMDCNYRCGMDYDECEHKKTLKIVNGTLDFVKKDDKNA